MDTARTIYDSVHRRYTVWPDALVRVLNTPEFQRLKRIKQLSVCHHVFPGATHTRYEHSIGVGYLAATFVRTLVRNQPTLVLRIPDAPSVGASGDATDAVIAFQLAGLCHDLGHGPLSHGFDTFLHTVDDGTPEHEGRSVALLRHMVAKYDLPLRTYVVDAACELIHPQRSGCVLPSWWYQVIANDDDSIDVDKFDYLVRDAAALGIGADLDLERFMEYARVCPLHADPGGHGTCLAYPTKLQHDVNALFLARHRLHAQVYQHPTVRAIERMHQDMLGCLRPVLEADLATFRTDPSALCRWTDDVFTHSFLELLWRQGQLPEPNYRRARTLLDRVERRELYRLVTEVRVPRQPSGDTTVGDTAVVPDVLPHTAQGGDEGGDEETASSSVPTPCYVDCVTIGYALNPVYRVRFYDKVHGERTHARHLTLQGTSHTFPVCSQDKVVRVYSTGCAHPTPAIVAAVERAAQRAVAAL
jgi:HD superfamily phosphohydrolase